MSLPVRLCETLGGTTYPDSTSHLYEAINNHSFLRSTCLFLVVIRFFVDEPQLTTVILSIFRELNVLTNGRLLRQDSSDNRPFAETILKEPFSEGDVNFRTPPVQLLRGSQMFKSCDVGRKEGNTAFFSCTCAKRDETR
jgi:hypothetical protein